MKPKLAAKQDIASHRGIIVESKLKHLEMLQGVINRMSVNSFLLKGWSVVIVSALFALTAQDAQSRFVYIAYFPVFAFWGLDGYFLSQERMFRTLYNRVRQMDGEQIDFSMNAKTVAEKRDYWIRSTLSKTMIVFHGIVLTTVVVVTVALRT